MTVRISVRISGKSPAPKKTITVSSFHHSSNLIAIIRKNATNSDIPKYPPPELVSDGDEWEVEQILGRRTRKRELEYKVKWKDWPKENDQWLSGKTWSIRHDYEQSTKKGLQKGEKYKCHMSR